MVKFKELYDSIDEFDIDKNAADGSFSEMLLPSNRMYLSICYNIEEQDKIFNTTKMHLYIFIVCRAGTYNIKRTDLIQTKIALDIPGSIVFDSSSWECEVGKPRLITDIVFEIKHNSDGSKRVRLNMESVDPIPIYSNITNSELPEDEWIYMTGAAFITLPTIPQTSTIVPFDDKVCLGDDFTVNINPFEPTYRHDVTWTLGEYSYTVMNVYDSATYQLPPEWGQMFPAADEMTGIVLVDAYNSDGIKMGSTAAKFIATLPEYTLKCTDDTPLIEDATDNNMQRFGYIQGVSAVGLTAYFPKLFEYGSKPAKVVFEGGGYKEVITEFESYSDELYSAKFTTGILNTSGTNEFTVVVIDTRGRKSEAYTGSVSVNAYSPPTFVSVVSERCEDDGSLKNEGTYLRSRVSYIYDDFNGQNTVIQRIYYKKSTDSDSGYVLLGTSFENGTVMVSTQQFDISTAYNIKYVITDNFTSSSYIDILPVSRITMEFLAGGKGISFGKEATIEDAADFEYKIYARRGIMPIAISKSGNLANGVNLHNYTLFAIVAEGIEEVIIISCALGASSGAASVSRVGTNESGLNGGPAIYGYRAEITISDDGDAYEAKVAENSILLFSNTSGIAWNIVQTEHNITKIYALI